MTRIKGVDISVYQKGISFSALKQAGVKFAIIRAGYGDKKDYTMDGFVKDCKANGIDIAKQMCALVADKAGIKAEDVVVASTGVIGQPLDIEPIKSGISPLFEALGDNSGNASEGIMTTDTVKKEIAVSFNIGGKECRIGGIAKGSGMIHPNMATMLVFITTDCSISSKMLQKALNADVKDNRRRRLRCQRLQCKRRSLRNTEKP